MYTSIMQLSTPFSFTIVYNLLHLNELLNFMHKAFRWILASWQQKETSAVGTKDVFGKKKMAERYHIMIFFLKLSYLDIKF
jgi:hypothetical protein